MNPLGFTMPLLLASFLLTNVYTDALDARESLCFSVSKACSCCDMLLLEACGGCNRRSFNARAGVIASSVKPGYSRFDPQSVCNF